MQGEAKPLLLLHINSIKIHHSITHRSPSLNPQKEEVADDLPF